MRRLVLFHVMDILLSLVRSLFSDRAELALENLALRQQVAVMQRKNPRPRLNDYDRAFWAALKGQLATWTDALIIVKPDTVVRWHRNLFRRHWARLSGMGRHPGRPRVSYEVRRLIRRMATENRWGAPRIHAEFLELGFDIAEVTVSRYMPKLPPDPDKIARWKAFLKNHMPEIAAMDFVTIPTAAFQLLHCLFIIHHDRRRLLHFAVTTNPTAAWVRQQIRDVFFDDPRIRYLIHDRDTRFNGIGEWLKSEGAKSVVTSYRSPWQNGVAERWVLSLRQGLLDHVVVFNESHVRRLISSFVAYYNEDRCHLSLNKDSPEPRFMQERPSMSAKVVAIPRVGGIHHRYEWRDAA